MKRRLFGVFFVIDNICLTENEMRVCNEVMQFAG